MGGFALLYSASTIIGAFLRKFKFPMLVGFLLAGLFLGGVAQGTFDGHNLEMFAEFGAAFLLFSVGLEIDFKHFAGFGWTIVWVSLLQMLMIFFLSFGAFLYTGYDWKAAFLFSMIVAFSSTVLVAMVLKERKELNALHGRILIGILLIQDLIVILLLFTIPYLAGDKFIVSELLVRLLLNILAIVLVVVVGRLMFKVLKRIFSGDREVVFLLSIAYLFAVMYFFSFDIINLPSEIAGLTAGLGLSSVFVRDRIASWFDPLRSFFLVFLFFYVGSQVDIGWFMKDFDKLIVLLAVVIFSKAAIGWLSAGVAGLPKKVIFLVGVGLANLSELGFVILPMSYRLGIITDRYLSLYSMLILVSIILSAIMLHNVDKICFGACDFFSLLERAKIFNPPKINGLMHGKKVLIGCHRAGRSIINCLDDYKDIVVMDFDINTVDKMREKGLTAVYCDATDKRSLREFELCRAKMVISTIPFLKDNLVIAEFINENCRGMKKPWMVFLAKNKSEVRSLYDSGADLVLDPYVSVADDFANVISTKRRKMVSQKMKKVQSKLLGL